MLKPFMQQASELEMTGHLGYEKHDPACYLGVNRRDGYYQRTLKKFLLDE